MNKHRKMVFVFFFITSLVISALLLWGCGGGGGGAKEPGGVSEWTYMVYMGADNNLSEAGLGDLNEMESVGSTSEVAIVLQAEFSTRYTPGVPPETFRLYVRKDGDPTSVNLSAGQNIGNQNMGDTATLLAFIKWAVQNHPARHYTLVIWDHGAGWKARSPQASSSIFRGAVQDETSGSFMSLPDLAKAVRNSGVHFDVIDFDACLMAMYEVAYEFRGLADYLVFSEETEPGEGDPYNSILSDLSSNPNMSGENLAATIVDRFDQYYASNQRGETTKSAIKMSEIAALDAKILELSAALSADAGTTAVVSAAQGNTREYSYASNHDIYEFSEYLFTNLPNGAARTVAGQLMAVISNMVVASKANPDPPNPADVRDHGLAIYLPTANETNTEDLAKYALLACNLSRASVSGTWGSYIESLVGAGGGNVDYGQGGFGVSVFWTNSGGGTSDADIDLYVWEPAVDYSTTGNGAWHAPFMGQTTPNGFFSMDSADSGETSEYYFANDRVYAGDYFFVINYYEDGSTSTQAEAHVLLYDPGIGQWFELTLANASNVYGIDLTYPSPQTLNLSSPWAGQTITSLVDLNAFSDYWVPDLSWGAKLSGGGVSPDMSGFPIGKKGSTLVLRFGRGSRHF